MRCEEASTSRTRRYGLRTTNVLLDFALCSHSYFEFRIGFVLVLRLMRRRDSSTTFSYLLYVLKVLFRK